MLDFTVGGMLAVLRRWPKLHEQLPMDAVFNEDLAVLATGMFMSMSKTDMLGYWKRIFSSGFRARAGVSRRPSPRNPPHSEPYATALLFGGRNVCSGALSGCVRRSTNDREVVP